MKQILFALFLLITITCCDNSEANEEIFTESSIYFPPITSDEWETKSLENAGWSEDTTALCTYLATNDTRAFIVLIDGKIVIEKYWGDNILGTASFEKSSIWYWASAGKTLTAFLTGIAQEKGFLNIDDKTSDYLGINWTDMSVEKEDLITIKHQLTMTTGLDYEVSDLDCTDSSCLLYKTDAGMQWYYHNASYTLIEKVISNASGFEYNDFTDEYLEDQTGISGQWYTSGYNNVYWSTARDAARFGLLLLNRGTWDDEQILYNQDYFDAMITTSQDLNPSYGYLTWLNGQTSIVLPGSETSYNISLSDNAPDDMYAAIGKNGQFIDVIPSENMIVVRMGESPSDALVPISFHNKMWELISELMTH
jgi:CubicO group peptidase (beta-lactamase class C family)